VARAISILREWSLDWLGRSNVKSPERKIDDPLTLLPRIFATLAGIVALGSSPAVKLLLPNLNRNSSFVLSASIALAALAVVNHVVTAKDTVETFSGIKIKPARIYRFSTTERLIAKGVTAFALLLLAANLIPTREPHDCSLTVNIAAQPGRGSAEPLLLSVRREGGQDQSPAEAGKPVPIVVPGAQVSRFSLELLWTDDSRSEFGPLAGCMAVAHKESTDGRAKISLELR
jgi:hypothetical protein